MPAPVGRAELRAIHGSVALGWFRTGTFVAAEQTHLPASRLAAASVTVVSPSAACCIDGAERLILSSVLVRAPIWPVPQGHGCVAQLVRAETVALKGPMLPEVSTARTRK